MSALEDLQKSISDMSDEELSDLLREIRQSKTNETVVAKVEKKRSAKKSEMEKLLAALTPEMKASLLASMNS